MLRELFLELYKKLENENENDKKSKNGYFEFFVNVILENDAYKIANFSISPKAVKNYYEKYVDQKENKSGEPKNELKNLIAKYLGFKNYSDFENSYEEIKTLSIEENKTFDKVKIIETDNPSTTKIIIGASILVISILLFIYQYNINNSGNCIIWKINHYETSSCENSKAIDNSLYNIDIENFKKIKATKETHFFEKGNPLVWYGKSSKGKIEFLTERGIHPETLKELAPISEIIINKYILTHKEDKTIY